MAGRTAVALAAALVLIGCHKADKTPPPPPTVLVAVPLQQQIVDWDDYVGRFEAVDSVDLRPRVSGYLTRITFKDGEPVAKGQLLFVIDPRPYRAVLNQAAAQTARAKATLNNALVELKRSQALFDAQAGSEQDLETRKATAQQAKADLGAAQANEQAAALNVAFTQIRAPISGHISDRRVAVGNLVTADQTVLTSLVSDNPIRFGFQASESLFLKRERANRRAVGDPVDIKLQDEPSYRWHGHIDFIDNTLDVNSGIIRGRAVVPNPAGTLRPGLYGHMRMPGSGVYTGLLVPDEAVTADQERQVVMTVGRDGKVKQRVVQVGPLVNGLRVIRSGLKADDIVVVAGLARARPGALVSPKTTKITPRPAPPPAPYTEPAASYATPAG
ncbi:RND family efflux transporter MFP subunit [Sphingomonas vulcanisoli]|uniref:RND family efflux transporter MFP subunit n=1 Tax=Sphingomonas vulcanisoli TaxID=1658060 RepID=A0ABX0TPB4_9SPHN|nr:efflux RND transporter periplasmic adaptor subunit [Sphingomonas vulcanisoli]NIJ07374.1 RND family efflux transporter MFP subunit [Sphingomonas vulcanisoli]